MPGLEGGADNGALEVLTFLDLPTAGLVTMGVNSDDGFRVTAGVNTRDAFQLTLGQFDGGRGAADTIFQFLVTAPGIYPFRLIWEQGTSGADLEWYEQDLNTTTPTFIAINAPAPAGGIASPGGGGPRFDDAGRCPGTSRRIDSPRCQLRRTA